MGRSWCLIEFYECYIFPLNDEDLADTLFADSPEYTGLADLDFKIIEPSGIDLPTRVSRLWRRIK